MRDLGVRVRGVGRGAIVGDAVGVTSDVLGRAHALVVRGVGGHDAADHVADAPGPVRGGAEMVVDHGPAAVELDRGLLRVQVLRVRHATYRKQDLVRVYRPALAAGREAD